MSASYLFWKICDDVIPSQFLCEVSGVWNPHGSVAHLAKKKMDSKKKYLVIGGGGFLGKKIADQLVERGESVAVIQKSRLIPY